MVISQRNERGATSAVVRQRILDASRGPFAGAAARVALASSRLEFIMQRASKMQCFAVILRDRPRRSVSQTCRRARRKPDYCHYSRRVGD
jgi:hypothetical protein